jgi:hypothetical protein
VILNNDKIVSRREEGGDGDPGSSSEGKDSSDDAPRGDREGDSFSKGRDAWDNSQGPGYGLFGPYCMVPLKLNFAVDCVS